MEDLAAFSAREVKRVAAQERERDEYSSAEGQSYPKRVKVKGKVIPTSFVKIEGERSLERDRRERGIVRSGR